MVNKCSQKIEYNLLKPSPYSGQKKTERERED